MNGKMIFMEQWFNSLKTELTNEQIGAVLYAAATYCYTGVKTDFGAAFGEDYKFLAGVMATLYPQIDNIRGYRQEKSKTGNRAKYDDDLVYELFKNGLTAKEVAAAIGIEPEKARSLYSNAGYKKFKKEKQS